MMSSHKPWSFQHSFPLCDWMSAEPHYLWQDSCLLRCQLCLKQSDLEPWLSDSLPDQPVYMKIKRKILLISSIWHSIPYALIAGRTLVVIPEPNRISTNRLRLSSHHLRIETGRWSRTPLEQRTCTCDTGIQSEEHILTVCPLSQHLRDSYNINPQSIYKLFNCEDPDKTCSNSRLLPKDTFFKLD